MRIIKTSAIALALSLVLSGCSLPLLTPKKAALQVTSNPRSTVFLDGKHVGQTPFFDDKLKPGEYAMKLVPEDPTGKLPAWETKIKLTPQILTVVNREIAPTDFESSGDILTLEPLSATTKNSLALISIPDSAVIKLDDQPQGFTPKSLEEISVGEHTISLAQVGYKEKTLRIKITAGHRLTISVQLAKLALLEEAPKKASPPLVSPTASPKVIAPEDDHIASASAAAKTKPYVEILPNTVGFLRIRQEPSTTGKEIARAVPGQRLPYLDEENNGWYKVTYTTGKTGWLARGAAGEYAKLVK